MHTCAMKQRIERLGGTWHDAGDEYYYLITTQPTMEFILAYVALPLGHPDNGKHYDDVFPEVNGGLTFSSENVFGWDYGHAYNPGNPEKDVQSALKYFKERANLQPE